MENKEWIVEIQEPEFTRNDLDSFLKFYKSECLCIKTMSDNDELISKWIRETKTL